MIGFVQRKPPTITVERLDESRVALLAGLDRQGQIELVVSHLRAHMFRNRSTSLQVMYRAVFGQPKYGSHADYSRARRQARAARDVQAAQKLSAALAGMVEGKLCATPSA